MEKQPKRHSFTGSLGFVLAAAGSAVGLGNIWRFPYLAAKDGGGMFIAVYIVLALTFGFTLLITEVAIGRRTKQSPLTAYGVLSRKWNWLGIVSCLVPAIIMPYYCVIGGWVLKYFTKYLTGGGAAAAGDGYFSSFISGGFQPILVMTVFMLATAFVVYRGVNSGIEKLSKILMPALVALVLVIAGFSLTITHTDGDTTRTGLQGLAVCLIPDFKGMTLGKLVGVVLDAMGQLFYSLSIAMGIMVAYGSYLHDDASIRRSVNRIEIFDTAIAILAGVMIIPAVFAFEGRAGMDASGPELMFVSLPRVFSEMGALGGFVGCIFFAMVLFAALTSAVSIMEAVVSSFMDKFKMSRAKAVGIVFGLSYAAAILVCLGYNALYFEFSFSTVSGGQILDILDFVSNNILMPVVAVATCILIGWIVKPKTVIDEVEKNGEKMGRRGLYIVMIKYIAPALLILLFLKSIGLLG